MSHITREELHEKVRNLVLSILARGRLQQQEIEGKLQVRDAGINVRKEQFTDAIMQLIEAHTRARVDEALEEQKELDNSEAAWRENRKGVDDYQKFKKGEPGSPERMAAWVHQLSPWNLERGVEALRSLLEEADRRARIDERKLIERDVERIRDKYDVASTTSDSPSGLPSDPMDVAEWHDQLNQSKMAMTFKHELLEANRDRIATLTTKQTNDTEGSDADQSDR